MFYPKPYFLLHNFIKILKINKNTRYEIIICICINWVVKVAKGA
jgi:hypothetical protein